MTHNVPYTPTATELMLFNPEGKPIGFIALPEPAPTSPSADVSQRLFMTASHLLYSLT
jgi:sugar lactone lactonase YvrE